MTSPLVSVVMPVYNGEKYLKEAIASILNQTFSDFEFIILNDGSIDRTEDIILSYDDNRICYIKNETNLQIAKTLNKGIKLAKGKYIARMDADDVALPHRLATQFDYMQANPDIKLCGSYLQIYEQSENIWKPPTNNKAIKAMLLFESCLYHPTIIFKKDIIVDNQVIYDPSFCGAEDYDLWQRLSETPSIHFANIPDVLLLYRFHPNNKTTYKAKQRKLANIIRQRQLKNLGIDITKQNFLLHEKFSYNDMVCFQLADLKHYEQWLNQIERANSTHAIYSPFFLKKELEYRWLKLCLQVAFRHSIVSLKFIYSHWSPNTLESVYHSTRMLWRSWKIR